jgi:hypothetical protein
MLKIETKKENDIFYQFPLPAAADFLSCTKFIYSNRDVYIAIAQTPEGYISKDIYITMYVKQFDCLKHYLCMAT